MKKKGFVFIETITILIVVTVSLSILLLSYSLIIRNTKAKLYYDKVPDKYMIYSIYNLGLDEKAEFNIDNIVKDPNYKDLKDKTGLTDIYVVDNVYAALSDTEATNKYLNGAIDYMKTLKKCNMKLNDEGKCKKPKKYLIGVFKKSSKYYYASIEI